MYKHTHKSIKSNTTPILDFTAEVEEAADKRLEDTEEMKSVTKQSKEEKKEKNHNYFIIRCCFLLLQKMLSFNLLPSWNTHIFLNILNQLNWARGIFKFLNI